MQEETRENELTNEIFIKPVGVVKSEIKKPILVANSSDIELQKDFKEIKEEAKEIQATVSELVIDSSLTGILDGIEDFSHILVLYWAHHVPSESRSLTKVHPMGRKELPLMGIFATCSPARPNPILVTAVRLLERKENVLKVEGFEAIDGSPIIDIKPYVPSYYAVEGVKLSDWMTRIEREYTAG